MKLAKMVTFSHARHISKFVCIRHLINITPKQNYHTSEKFNQPFNLTIYQPIKHTSDPSHFQFHNISITKYTLSSTFIDPNKKQQAKKNYPHHTTNE